MTSCVFLGLHACSLHGQSDGLVPTKLPQGANGHRAHRLDDRLFVFGGFGPGAIEFDFESKTWSRFPPMKVRKVFFGSVVVKGQIHAIGGASKRNEPGVIEKFDSLRNQWEVVLRSDSLPKTHLSAAAVNNRIYIAGGLPKENSGIHFYDVHTRKFAAMPALPDAKPGDHFYYMATLNNRLHILGGMRLASGDGGAMDQHWMWDGEVWKKKAVLPTPSIAKFAVYGVVGDKLYVFNKIDGLHHRYDPNADSWAGDLAPMPTILAMPAVVPDKNRLLVLGGIVPSRKPPHKAILVYDVIANRWR